MQCDVTLLCLQAEGNTSDTEPLKGNVALARSLQIDTHIDTQCFMYILLHFCIF